MTNRGWVIVTICVGLVVAFFLMKEVRNSRQTQNGEHLDKNLRARKDARRQPSQVDPSPSVRTKSDPNSSIFSAGPRLGRPVPEGKKNSRQNHSSHSRWLAENRQELGQGADFSIPNSKFESVRMRARPVGGTSGRSPSPSVIPGFQLYPVNNPTHLEVSDSYPVVVSRTNGRLGVVTGTILAQIESGPKAEQVAEQHGLGLVHWDPTLHLAFFKAPPAEALQNILREMARDPEVRNLRLEILQGKGKASR
ncbi:MAG: hypothetical protein AB7F86_09085 [Bdellovibrionales bacterium]